MAQKPTFSLPTKMFDHSNERSWPEFFENMIKFLKIISQSGVMRLVFLPNYRSCQNNLGVQIEDVPELSKYEIASLG